ncbi:MAG: zf-HC2 domain-containing protein [Verrucomicrobiota bacterium]|jgi:anti-sigma factor RsiW
MNCRGFQNNLFEYLDGALSSGARAAAERHLAQCEACRQVLRRQQQIAQALSERFHRDTAGMALRPEAQRRILAALADQSADRAERNWFAGLWPRLAWPAAITAGLLVAAWLVAGFPFGPRAPRAVAARSSGRETGVAVTINISDCAPTYVFRREGNFVIDALTCQPRVAAQTLWLTLNQKPAPKG